MTNLWSEEEKLHAAVIAKVSSALPQIILETVTLQGIDRDKQHTMVKTLTAPKHVLLYGLYHCNASALSATTLKGA